MQRLAMTAAHLNAVHGIEVTAYSHPWSRGNFWDSLQAGHPAQVLLDNQGALVGYWLGLVGVDELHLLNVTVAPAHQGQGWGQLLLADVQAQGRRLGLGSLWLEVRQSNQRAQALYQRLGFEAVGRRRAYYPAATGREDAVVMRLGLGLGGDAAVVPTTPSNQERKAP